MRLKARLWVATGALVAVCGIQAVPALGSIDLALDQPTAPVYTSWGTENGSVIDVTNVREARVRIEPISTYFQDDWALGDPSVGFFPHEFQNFEPLPDSPIQSEITLRSGEPLAILHPIHLQRGFSASFDVRQEGNDIFLSVVAQQGAEQGNIVTGVWYPRGDMLTPIGELESGDYRLHIETTLTSERYEYPTDGSYSDFPTEGPYTSTSTWNSQLRFTVLPDSNAVVVPEPSSAVLLAVSGGACLVLLRRQCRCERSLPCT